MNQPKESIHNQSLEGYYNLLSQRKKLETDLFIKRKIVNNKIQSEKKRLHVEFMKTHGIYMRWLDILVIILILANFGAATITSIMVQRTFEQAAEQKTIETGQKVNVVYQEFNPITAVVNGYEQHKESVNFLKIYLVNAIFWFILCSIYIYLRNTVYNEEMFLTMVVVVFVYFVIMTSDFSNNIGFYLGKMFFGPSRI